MKYTDIYVMKHTTFCTNLKDWFKKTTGVFSMFYLFVCQHRHIWEEGIVIEKMLPSEVPPGRL